MWVFSNIYCPLKLKYAYIYFNPFSVWPRFYLFTMYHYTSIIDSHAYMYTYFRCARNLNALILCKYILPSFGEVKVLQQQNMLNVHHMPTLACEVFKWNYEHHLYGHTFKLIFYSFASTNEPLIELFEIVHS